MTWATLRTNRRGSLVAGLFIEGIGTWFSTNRIAWPSLPVGLSTAGWSLTPLAALDKHGLEWAVGVDIKSGDMRMPGVTFRLTDCDDVDGNRFAVSNLLTGMARANLSELRATLSDTEVATITIQDTPETPWATPGVAYVDLEAIAFTGSTGTTLTGLTRAYYGSKSVVHTYDPSDANDLRPDGGLIPEITNAPVSWYGRRCWLYLAELQPNGTVAASPELVWQGKIKGALTMDADGLSYVLPTESVWESQASEVLAQQPATHLRGIYLGTNLTVEIVISQDGVQPVGSFTVDADTYPTAEELAAHLTARLNTAMAAIASAPLERYEFRSRDGFLDVALTAPHDGANNDVSIIWTGFTMSGRVLATFLGVAATLEGGPQNGAYQLVLPILGRQDGFDLGENETVPTQLNRAATFIAWIVDTERSEIPVASKVGFSAFDAVTVDADNQPIHRTTSVVLIQDTPYILRALAAGATQRITIEGFHHVRIGRGTVQILATYEGDSPLECREGIWLEGRMWSYLKEGFVEQAAVPDPWKAGLDTADFDWADMQDQLSGGLLDQRDRLILKPTPFREILLEDLVWSGLVPAMKSGKITCRPMQMAADSRVTTTIAATSTEFGKPPGETFSEANVINQIVFHMVREHTRPRNTDNLPYEVTVINNQRTSQQRYKVVSARTIEGSGMRAVRPDELAAVMSGMAGSYFVLVSRDFPELQVPASGFVAGLVPMDSAYLTHWLLPNHAVANARGITNALVLVTGIRVRPFDFQCDVDCVEMTDNVRRGGIAPSARVNAYAAAGPSGHQLTISPLNRYSADNEGLHFPASAKVELRQWDDDTAPASESLTLFSTPTDAAGTLLYLTSAPANNVAVGTWVVTLDEYDTALQVDDAQEFYHIADETTGLIGASGDRGFKPG